MDWNPIQSQNKPNETDCWRKSPKWSFERENLRNYTIMIKHSYQTCLRMPQVLKEDMTTICERYQINESDFMRRAIVEFVTNIQQNPDKTFRHMFIWSHTRTSLGYDTRQDLSDTMLGGLFCGLRTIPIKGWKTYLGVLSSGSKFAGYGVTNHPEPIFLYPPQTYCVRLSVWEIILRN